MIDIKRQFSGLRFREEMKTNLESLVERTLEHEGLIKKLCRYQGRRSRTRLADATLSTAKPKKVGLTALTLEGVPLLALFLCQLRLRRTVSHW